jgi:hypothetical protein
MGVGLGHAGVFVGFVNTSSTECSLRGRPRVKLVTAEGEALSLPQKDGTYITDNDDTERVVLVPGLPVPTARTDLERGHALLPFEWMACRPQPKIGTIVVSLRRGGGSLSVPVGPRGIGTSGEPMCWPGRTVEPWLAVGTYENAPF